MTEKAKRYRFRFERDLRNVIEAACGPENVYPLEMRSGGKFGVPDLMVVEPRPAPPAQITFVELKLVAHKSEKLRWTRNQLPLIYRLLNQAVRVLILEGIKGTDRVTVIDCYHSTYIDTTGGDNVTIGAFVNDIGYAQGQETVEQPKAGAPAYTH